MGICRYLLFLLVFIACSQTIEQTNDTLSNEQPASNFNPLVKKSAVDYTLILDDSLHQRILSFSKHQDSSYYSHLKYTCWCEESAHLEKQIPYIEKLWQNAEDSIDIRLHSVDVGYPLLYDDLLKRHIEAFAGNEEWKHHEKSNTGTINYELMRKIMRSSTVYQPLNGLLEKFNYRIVDFSTEKHGYVTPDVLTKMGYSDSLQIPLPYIVVIILAPE
ncbi:MAG: hypothetical protein R3345_01260 [Fulvivirga sp.]|nr:hypothetical protein [Fulvivirga sp.]